MCNYKKSELKKETLRSYGLFSVACLCVKHVCSDEGCHSHSKDANYKSD